MDVVNEALEFYIDHLCEVINQHNGTEQAFEAIEKLDKVIQAQNERGVLN